ncbi:MAG TPA: 3-carboxy-cis,cis-muconate cycloisomerase [Stellaceae bacterium]|nr:3-carboxy-cis,cis-muconate cycloisomerase [Stellaceae bacterium]
MSVNPADSVLLGGLFGTDEMRATFGERGFVQKMLDVEAALARVEARLGIIPDAAAQAITAAAQVDRLALRELGESTRTVGAPVVGLVKALGRAAGGDADRYVHWGATTQDIMDTALVLQMREGLALIERRLRALIAALADQARQHRATVMAGRSFLQHALPITFGHKCAVWLAPFLDHVQRLEELRARVLAVQFGGAVGTLASLGTKGRDVTLGLAQELGLAAPDSPWHVNRERPAEVACFLGLIAGSLAKIATDTALLMQTEVGEAAEPYEAGRGGSSTMPQKRNPVASAYIIAAARGVHALVPQMLAALAQDHERATGAWQSEWLALPQIFTLSDGALVHGVALARGLSIDAERMRRTLESQQGLIMAEAVMMALAEKLGRGAAHHAVQHACARALDEGRALVDVLAQDAAVTAEFDRAALERLKEPGRYLGEALAVVDRVLARVAATGGVSGG